MAGYMAAGAVVAGGVALFGALGTLAPALRPLWTAAHAAAFGLGGWLLATGRLPIWLATLGSAAPLRAADAGWQPVATPLHAAASQRISGALRAAESPRMAGALRAAESPRMAGALRAAGVGTLWAALPCGLLQSALIVAALASTPLQGALAMGAFAATSSVGLAGFAALWSRGAAPSDSATWAVRASGALLLASSGWALGHGLWQRVAALCAAL